VPLDPATGSFLRYRLAATPYIPEGSAQHPDFWITTDPNEGRVLVQFANYYLLKKRLP
jgi:hypothetical protein